MQSPEFRRVNLPNATSTEIANAVQLARSALGNTPVRNRHDVYVLASSAAQLLKRNIGLPVQACIFEFTSGTIAALDPYSAFMSSNQYDETMSQIEGNFVGLGVELRTHPDHLEIVSVIPANMQVIRILCRISAIRAMQKP